MNEQTTPPKKRKRWVAPGCTDLNEYTVKGEKRKTKSHKLKTVLDRNEMREPSQKGLSFEQKITELTRKGVRTLYKHEFCDEIVKFFDRPYTKITEVEGLPKVIPNDFPTFERFAVNIGVTHATLCAWVKRFPAFADSYQQCKDIQRDFLISNGLKGIGSTVFTIFVAKALADLRDISHYASVNVNTHTNKLDAPSKEILLDILKSTGREVRIAEAIEQGTSDDISTITD